MKRTLLISVLVCLPVFLLAQTTATFTLGGTQTFVSPAGITSITVQAWGAGGAGGSSSNPGFNGAYAGSGGGGGAFASTGTVPLTITSGETLTVNVGIGGKGVTSANGGAGGSSGITGYSILADGGKGGLLNNGSLVLGGAAGLAANSTGTIRTSGTAGGNGEFGFTDDTGSIISSGAGGNGANGGGTGGAGIATAFTSSVGNAGNAPGGGGSGGRSSFLAAARRGGDGGDGKVTITYNCPTYSLTNTTATAVNVCSGTSSEITLTGNLPVGLYSVSYNIQGTAQTPASMNVTTTGTGSFIATGFTTVGSRTITITSLSSGSSSVASENCVSPINQNNLATITVNSSGTAPVATAGSNATCTQITANWQAVSGATYYELDVSTVSDFSSLVSGYSALNVGNVLSKVVNGSTNTTYYYRVRAYNGSCISSNSNTISYATPVAPVAPVATAGTVVTCSQFTANWGTVSGATSYIIDVSTQTGANFAANILGSYNNLNVGNVLTKDITGLSASTNYYYRVRATNSCGTSGNSNIINVATVSTAVAVPTAPTLNAISGATCSQFTVNWNVSARATSYSIEVSTQNGGGFTANVLAGYNNLNVGNVLSKDVTGLSANTTYYYRIKAINSCGTSGASSIGTGATTNTGAGAAATPVSASGTGANCSQITANWNTAARASSYVIDVSTQTGANFATGILTSYNNLNVGNVLTKDITGLTAGTTYYYRVRATNNCGTSGNSSVITYATAAVPSTPTITADGALTICQTDGVKLTSSSATGNVWSTGETTPDIFVTAAGSYTVKVISGGCSSATSAAKVIVVEGLPTATAGGSTTICSNRSATVSGASASNGTIKWTFSGGSGTLTGDTTLTPTYTPTLGGAARTVILTMTVTSSNTCAPQIATATYTINIQAAPTASITGSKIICSNDSATVGAGEANAANGTVSWTHDGLGTLSNSTTLTPTYTAVAGDAGKQVTLTLNVTASPACATAYTVSDVYTIAVRPENTVTAASSSPVLCVNTLMANITHTTTGATGIGTPSGLPTGVTASWASNTITISGTPSNTGTFNYSIPLTGGCGTYNAIGTIVVNLNTAGTASSSPTVCSHTVMPDITHTTTGATGIGSPSGLPPGITANWASNTITISGTPTNIGTYNYTIPLTGGCGTVNATGTITVNPLPVTPAVGTIVQPTCANQKGSITLHGLLSGVNWTITQTGTVSQTYNTTDTDFTISNLIPGIYNFTVHEGANCPSMATVNVEIKAPVTNVWNGSSWSNGNPVSTDIIEFAADYQSTADLSGCSCKVDAGKKVTINSGHTLTIENDVVVESASGALLTFEDSASLIQVNNVLNSGSIIYKRNSIPIRQADYVYWSTPVQGQTLSGVSSETASDKYLIYNGSQWVAVPKTTVMTIGKGYIIRGPETYSNTVRTPFTASFQGVPNNGDINGEAVSAGKYYLVGNPYPSALDADDFINANSILEGTLYFWTHNTPVVLGGAYQYATDDYATYNLSGGVGTAAAPSGTQAPGNNANVPSGQIAAGQSFFAKMSGSGTITFNNLMRNGGNNNGQFFKPKSNSKANASEKHRIWLNMTNEGGAFKQLMVGYIQGASNDFEKKYDGVTFDGNKYLDFYSVNNEKHLVIQGRALPFSDIDLVPLGYRTTIAGEFIVSISQVDGNMKDQAIYLEDKMTGKIHDLRESNYTFKTEAGTFTDRLVLRYTNKSLGTTDVENKDSKVLITVKDKVIKVTSTVEMLEKVYIFDVSGKLLYEKLNINEKELQIDNLQSSNQVLLVKVALENGNITNSKVIF
ncbi:Fibronectin type III domain-containing protein [Flavobacterium resistens]|uniref:Fibronectin type III domain-containing protein n=1 Tax=Flavobacterium resistens TaxID=443612 RepID=A0A521E634_9FLAO|nr:fibronectin type III domain-containing protein [Flavobacterium resistens]MRX69159.1 T9SS sorting signal type C domain-containing protein [Flavobacterium resistens]SMO79403.1 Fibronectin type III domain-containing protein [Flavobacterium resistens]